MRAVLLVGVIGLLAFAPAAPAAVITVTRTDDPAPDTCSFDGCSLREAIAEAVDGVDTVRVPASAYQVTAGELLVDKTVTITGDGARATTISGDADNRVLQLAGLGKTLTMTGVTVTGGTVIAAPGVGAGIEVSAGALVLGGVAVTNNRIAVDSNAFGGGIDLDGADTSATLTGVTVAGNQANADLAVGVANGGGIANRGGTLTLTNSTISGNVATIVHAAGNRSNGGGALTGNGGTTTLNSSTVVGNSVAAAGAPLAIGGNLVAESSVVTLKGTIVSAGSAEIGPNCALQGVGAAFATQGGNVESLNECGLSGGDFPNADPQLGPLRDHGGQTDTHALLGPAVVDAAGACGQAADQRGVARSGACDAGALENEAPIAAASARFGPPAVFDGSASRDPDGDALGFSWAFDEGAAALGALVQRSFATTRAHAAMLTVRDPAGATSTATAIATPTPGAAGTGSQPGRVAPGARRLIARLTSLRLSRSVFRAAPSATPLSRAGRRRYGARVSYRLSSAARTTFTVERARGRRTSLRYVRLRGSLTRRGLAGANALHFSGRIGGRRLSPGRYRLVARVPGGIAVRHAFRIVR